MHTVGFLINPIAGMGGRVGLKGTDGMVEEAIRRGAREISGKRAREFLKALGDATDLKILTVAGKMGELVLRDFNIPYEIVYAPPERTTAKDTKEACRKFVDRGAELIVFVGGDGTARDVVEAVDRKLPILGIPSGVKMYSSVFAISPEKGAEVLKSFLQGSYALRDAEVLDIDEESYRNNVLRIKLFGFAMVPYVEELIQSSKSEYGGEEEEEDKESIAEYIVENMEKDTLYLLGAGTTVAKIAEKLGVEKTLLGIDALYNGKIIAKDLAEKDILHLLEKYHRVKLIITPIGSQGFIFGRGNQQLSGEVLRRIGKENIIVIATPRKLQDLEKLRIDVEGKELLQGYYKVLYGYGRYKVMKAE